MGMIGRWVMSGVILAATAVWSPAGDVRFSPEPVAVASLDRTQAQDGWRFTCTHDILSPTEIRLGTFTAQRGQMYTVECLMSSKDAAIAPVTLKVRWLDAQGKDAAALDQQLGYPDPTLSAGTAANWAGAAVVLRAGGKPAMTDMNRGEIVLVIAKMAAGQSLEIGKVSISESAAQAAPKLKATIEILPQRNSKGSIYFPDESARPEVKVAVRNRLAKSQAAVLSGRILDSEGKQTGVIRQELPLEASSSRELELNVPAPTKFGAYTVELRAMVDGKPAGETLGRFVWAPRPTTSEEVRHHALYPFDMHPDNILMLPDGNPKTNLAEAAFQAGLMQRLGVRAIRLQNYYWDMDYADRAGSVAAVEKRLDTWKKTIWPILKEHGIDVWVSFMEQGGIKGGGDTIPKTPEQLQTWHDYHYAQVKAFGDIPMFYLFGNEGLGGKISGNLDAEVMLYHVPPHHIATTRQWMTAYQSVYDAAKKANPNCIIGPSHAADPEARVAQAYIKMFGKDGKADIWAYNSYQNTAEIGKTIRGTLKKAGYEPKFAVVPEFGLNAEFAGEMRISQERKQAISVVQTYLTTLTDGWVKRIDWFILHYGKANLLNVFDDAWMPRPCAASYLVMADTLRAGQVEKRITLPGGGEFYVWRRIDGSVVGVGWAPGEKVITLQTQNAGEVEVVDLYGNREKRQTSKGIITLALKDAPVYVLGAKSLDESKALQVSIANATRDAARPNVVAIQVRNNTDAPQKISIASQPLPGVTVTPTQAQVDVKPGQVTSGDFEINVADYNDRVRSQVGFKISNNDYLAFETKVNDTFARCAFAKSPPSLDGTWKGWEQAQVLHADQANQAENVLQLGIWRGPDDLSAVIRTMWDDEHFYVGVQTTDDVFLNQQDAGLMFLGDAIEIGLDLEHNLANDAKIWQFMASRCKSGDVTARFTPSPYQLIKTTKLAIHPSGIKGGMIYQLAIPWSEMGNFQPAPGKQIGFGLIADDSDVKPGDRRIITWFGRGVHTKQPSEMGDLIFVK